MSVFKKLFNLVRGSVNNAAESVADANAITILNEELRQSKIELRKSDEALVSIIAKRKLSQQKVNSFDASISEYEKHARTAMEKGQQELALECAQKVAELRSEQSTEQAYCDGFLKSETTMKSKIAQAKERLRQIEQQVDVVAAQESVIKAQSSVAAANAGSNSKMSTALDSLDRIKARQAEASAKFEAAEELESESSSSSLDKKLAEAGISKSASSAEDELARILGK